MSYKKVYNREEFLALGAEEIARRATILFKVYYLVGFISGIFVTFISFN